MGNPAVEPTVTRDDIGGGGVIDDITATCRRGRLAGVEDAIVARDLGERFRRAGDAGDGGMKEGRVFLQTKIAATPASSSGPSSARPAAVAASAVGQTSGQ